jgi:hypothetical protein
MNSERDSNNGRLAAADGVHARTRGPSVLIGCRVAGQDNVIDL